MTKWLASPILWMMAPKGRPRLSPEDVQQRVSEYCRRYHVVPRADDGLPPFPSGKRETAQHREWLLVYKAHRRLARRALGRCELCEAPAEDGSIFCPQHAGGGPVEDDGPVCPICRRAVDAGRDVRYAPPASDRRLLLHLPCRRLLRLAERAGREPLERAIACLWPSRRREASSSGVSPGPTGSAPRGPGTS